MAVAMCTTSARHTSSGRQRHPRRSCICVWTRPVRRSMWRAALFCILDIMHQGEQTMIGMVAGADQHAIAPSLYKASTELSADSIEAHPALPYVFAESTYQVDKHDDGTDASEPSSPSYTRRGRCRLRHTELHEDGNLGKCVRLPAVHRSPSSTVLDTVEGAAILDAKWYVFLWRSEQDSFCQVPCVADTHRRLRIWTLESGRCHGQRFALSPRVRRCGPVGIAIFAAAAPLERVATQQPVGTLPEHGLVRSHGSAV